MADELTNQINTIMQREMGEIGTFIVRKQCVLIEADPDSIESRDLPRLASKLSEVMKTFGGHEKAKNIFREIKNLENLEQIVQDEESEEKKMQMLEDLGKGSLYAGEWDKATEYFDRLIEEAEKNKDSLSKSRNLIWRGFIHHEKGEFSTALEYYEDALKNAKKSRDKSRISECLNAIGSSNWYMGDYQKAMDTYNESVKMAEASGNKDALGVAHIGIGNISSDINNIKKAKENYNQALKDLEGTENHQQIARVHNNLGDTYMRTEDWDQALECFAKSREFAEKGGWLSMKAWAEFNSSEALINLGKLDSAKETLDKAFKALSEIGDLVGLGGAYQVYGKLYHAKEDWNTAILSYSQALNIYTDLNLPKLMATSFHELGNLYLKNEDVDSAKEHLNSAASIYHKLNLDSMVEDIVEVLESL